MKFKYDEGREKKLFLSTLISVLKPPFILDIVYDCDTG